MRQDGAAEVTQGRAFCTRVDYPRNKCYECYANSLGSNLDLIIIAGLRFRLIFCDDKSNGVSRNYLHIYNLIGIKRQLFLAGNTKEKTTGFFRVFLNVDLGSGGF